MSYFNEHYKATLAITFLTVLLYLIATYKQKQTDIPAKKSN
jgi:hypothetical protein